MLGLSHFYQISMCIKRRIAGNQMELRSHCIFREAEHMEFRVMEVWLWISALLAAGSFET